MKCYYCGEWIKIEWGEPEPDASRLVTCDDCGRGVSKRAHQCPGCGAPMVARHSGGYAAITAPVRAKSRFVYIALGIFFGLLGAHSFYAGYYRAGLLQLFLGLVGFATFLTWIPLVMWVLFDVFQLRVDARGVLMD